MPPRKRRTTELERLGVHLEESVSDAVPVRRQVRSRTTERVRGGRHDDETTEQVHLTGSDTSDTQKQPKPLPVQQKQPRAAVLQTPKETLSEQLDRALSPLLPFLSWPLHDSKDSELEDAHWQAQLEAAATQTEHFVEELGKDASQESGIDAALAQALWCLYLASASSFEAEPKRSVVTWPDVARTRWTQLLRRLLHRNLLSKAVLVRWLPPESWQQTGLVSELDEPAQWTRSVRRLHTRIHYTQPVYQVFREQPLGFASLLSAFTIWMENADAFSTDTKLDASSNMKPDHALDAIVNEHLSTFHIETNRAYDLGIQMLIAIHEWKLRQHRKAALLNSGPAAGPGAELPQPRTPEEQQQQQRHSLPDSGVCIRCRTLVEIEQALINWLRGVPSRNAAQLLGFRLQQLQSAAACVTYQKAVPEERLPEAVFLVAARLIHERIVSLEQLWPHVVNADYEDAANVGTDATLATSGQTSTTASPPPKQNTAADARSARAAPIDPASAVQSKPWDELGAFITAQTKALARVRLVERDCSREQASASERGSQASAATASRETDNATKAVDAVYDALSMRGILAPIAGELALLAALIDYDELHLVETWIQRVWLADLTENATLWHCRRELVYAAAPLRYALFAYIMRHISQVTGNGSRVVMATGADAAAAEPSDENNHANDTRALLLRVWRLLGGHLVQRPELFKATWSIVSSTRAVKRADPAVDAHEAQVDSTVSAFWAGDGILPCSPLLAVLFSQGSAAVPGWLFGDANAALSSLPYAYRYALYLNACATCVRLSSSAEPRASVLIPFWHALYRSMSRRLLRRLAGDTIGYIAKSLEPMLYSEPWAVARIILDQVQSYDNLVEPVVEMLMWLLRARTDLSSASDGERVHALAFALDVFFALFVEELAGSAQNGTQRPRIRSQESGGSLASWFLNTIELVVQLSRRMVEHLAALLPSNENEIHGDESVDPAFTLQQVLQDCWRALLQLAERRIIRGDYAFYALIQRALECMGGIQPWDDEMLNNSGLESLARPAIEQPTNAETWRFLQTVFEPETADASSPTLALLVALDAAKHELLQELAAGKWPLRTATVLLDALHATFLQLASFGERQRAASTTVTQLSSTESASTCSAERSSSAPSLGLEKIGDSLCMESFLCLCRMWGYSRPSAPLAETSRVDVLERRLGVMIAEADTHHQDRLRKAGVASFAELVSLEWLHAFWRNEQPPDGPKSCALGTRPFDDIVNADNDPEQRNMRIQIVAEFLLERCFLPWVLMKPAAYNSAIAWIELLAQDPNPTPFNVLLLLTLLFKTAFLQIVGMTRLECIRLARFVRQALRLTDRWLRYGPDAWQRYRCSRVTFQGRGGTPCQWAQYVLWHGIMREKMLNTVCEALEKLPESLVHDPSMQDANAGSPLLSTTTASAPGPEDAPSRTDSLEEHRHMTLGNMLRALNVMVEEFPSRNQTASERMEKALTKLIEHEQNATEDQQHTDILTLATSYLGHLRSRQRCAAARQRATAPPAASSVPATSRMGSKERATNGALIEKASSKHLDVSTEAAAATHQPDSRHKTAPDHQTGAAAQRRSDETPQRNPDGRRPQRGARTSRPSRVRHWRGSGRPSAESSHRTSARGNQLDPKDVSQARAAASTASQRPHMRQARSQPSGAPYDTAEDSSSWKGSRRTLATQHTGNEAERHQQAPSSETSTSHRMQASFQRAQAR